MPAESAYFLEVIATVMRLLGRSNREIEGALGWSAGYLSRLLAGDKNFRFEHLVDLAAALGLSPQELVWIAYPETGEPLSGPAERLWRGMVAPGLPPVPGSDEPGGSLAERSAAEEKLAAVVERVLARMLDQLAPLAARGGEPAASTPRRPRTAKPARDSVRRKDTGGGKGGRQGARRS